MYYFNFQAQAKKEVHNRHRSRLSHNYPHSACVLHGCVRPEKEN